MGQSGHYHFGITAHGFKVALSPVLRREFPNQRLLAFAVVPHDGSTIQLPGNSGVIPPLRNADYKQIVGYVDDVHIDSNGDAYITGWACANTYPMPIDVLVYLSGPPPAGVPLEVCWSGDSCLANVNLGEFSVQCGSNSPRHHNFRIPLSHEVRRRYANQPLYLYGLSPYGTPHANLPPSDRGTITVPP